MTTEKIIFTSPGGWLEVIETPRKFYYARRKGKDSIAVFLWKAIDPENIDSQDDIEVLVRYQPLPVHNADIDEEMRLYACPVTGSIEPGEDYTACAQREVLEETGYEIHHLKFLEKYILGTQTDETCYIYQAQVFENTARVGATQDGTYFESISQNKWEPLKSLKDSEYAACRIFYYRMLLDILGCRV